MRQLISPVAFANQDFRNVPNHSGIFLDYLMISSYTVVIPKEYSTFSSIFDR